MSTFEIDGTTYEPWDILAHVAYSEARTRVTNTVDGIVPYIVPRPHAAAQHDITAGFTDYMAGKAFYDAIRAHGSDTPIVASIQPSAGTVTRRNIAQNPSFSATGDVIGPQPAARRNIAGYPRCSDTSRFNGGGGGSYTISTASSGGPLGIGYFQAQAVADDTDSPQSYTMSDTGTDATPVTGGETYTVSWYAYQTVDETVSRTDIAWYDAGGSVITSGGGDTAAVPINTWTRVTRTTVAPANAAFMRVSLILSGSPTSGTVLRWANALVELGERVLPYFDGIYVDDPNLDVTGDSVGPGAVSEAWAHGVSRPDSYGELAQDGGPAIIDQSSSWWFRGQASDTSTQSTYSGALLPEGNGSTATSAIITEWADPAARYLAAGRTYRISVDVTLLRPQTGTLNASARSVVVIERNATDDGDVIGASAAAPNTAGTHRITVTHTIADPGSGNGGYLLLVNGSEWPDEPIYFDRMLIEDVTDGVPADADYFDGDTPESDGLAGYWEGAPGASTSVLAAAGQHSASFEGFSVANARLENDPGQRMTRVLFTLVEVPDRIEP